MESQADNWDFSPAVTSQQAFISPQPMPPSTMFSIANSVTNPINPTSSFDPVGPQIITAPKPNIVKPDIAKPTDKSNPFEFPDFDSFPTNTNITSKTDIVSAISKPALKISGPPLVAKKVTTGFTIDNGVKTSGIKTMGKTEPNLSMYFEEGGVVL